MSEVQISVLDDSISQRWKNNTTPDATAYQTPEWSKVINESYGHEALVLHDESFDSILPVVCIRSRIFGSHLVSMPFVEYGGPIMKGRSSFAGMVAKMDEYARQNGFGTAELRLAPEQSNLADEMDGFKARDGLCTFLANLKDSGAMFESLSKDVRWSINRATNSGVEISEAKSIEDLHDYYMLYLKTMKKHGTPPHSRLFFESMWRIMGSMMRVMLAKHEGNLVSGSIFFLFNKRIFHWSSVSDDRYNHLNAGSLLLWDTLEWGSDNGFSSFDFGRTTVGTGVYEFKKEWGGEEVKICHMVKSYGRSKPTDPDDVKFKIASNVWKLLPTSVSEALGKYLRKNITL